MRRAQQKANSWLDWDSASMFDQRMIRRQKSLYDSTDLSHLGAVSSSMSSGLYLLAMSAMKSASVEGCGDEDSLAGLVQ